MSVRYAMTPEPRIVTQRSGRAPEWRPASQDGRRWPVVLALGCLVLMWFFSRSAIFGTLALVERMNVGVTVDRFVWASPNAVLRGLPASTDVEAVTLIGRAAHDQRWIVQCGPSLRVAINLREGLFQQNLPTSDACVRFGIAIASDWSFVPAASTGWRDPRSLSFQLYEIRVGSTSVPLAEIASTSDGLYELEQEDLRNDVIGMLTGRFDSIWYKRIATSGYRFNGDPGLQQDVAWPFLYPMLAKAIAATAGIEIRQAMVDLNSGLALGVLLLLFLLGRKLHLSVPEAMVAPAWVACNPFAFFVFGGFSEALFLLLECAFVVLLISRRYFSALVVVALLGACRFVGLLFVVPLLFALGQAGASRGRWGFVKAGAVVAVAALGVAADIGVKWYQTGHPLAAFVIRGAFVRTSFDQWSELYRIERLAQGEYLPLLLLTIAMLTFCIVVWFDGMKRHAQDPSVQVVGVGSLIVVATLLLNPELHSIGRYALPLAPAIAGALAARQWQGFSKLFVPTTIAAGAVYLPFVVTRIGNGWLPF